MGFDGCRRIKRKKRKREKRKTTKKKGPFIFQRVGKWVGVELMCLLRSIMVCSLYRYQYISVLYNNTQVCRREERISGQE